MRVVVDLPDDVWGRLATRADSKGVKVADIITTAIRREVRQNRRRPLVNDLLRDRVRLLWSLNRSDVEIAADMGLSQDVINATRKDMGLAPLRGALK